MVGVVEVVACPSLVATFNLELELHVEVVFAELIIGSTMGSGEDGPGTIKAAECNAIKDSKRILDIIFVFIY